MLKVVTMMFKKWELVEENKQMVKVSTNLFSNFEHTSIIRCDVYRKLRWNGIWKYKYVKRY